jgi:23S rRNA pseudouridine2605 synthase
VPEWAKPPQNNKRRGKGGRGGERQGGSSPSKRERLQKVMAQSGHGSRRNIEILIAQGHLTINGQLAKLGDAVGPGRQGEARRQAAQPALRRPAAARAHVPQARRRDRVARRPEKRPTVFDKLPRVHGGRWVSVGRLDFNTEGLLIFTTSGELANRLTHPRFEVEREYAVRVMGELTEEQRQKLLTGVDIEGESCKFDSIDDRGGEGSNRWYHVILREGKNREVRKMMEAVGPHGEPPHARALRQRGAALAREARHDPRDGGGAGAGPPRIRRDERAPPGETESEDDVEDEMDNIGNRAPRPVTRAAPPRDSRRRRHRQPLRRREGAGRRVVADEGHRQPRHLRRGLRPAAAQTANVRTASAPSSRSTAASPASTATRCRETTSAAT